MTDVIKNKLMLDFRQMYNIDVEACGRFKDALANAHFFVVGFFYTSS